MRTLFISVCIETFCSSLEVLMVLMPSPYTVWYFPMTCHIGNISEYVDSCGNGIMLNIYSFS